MAEIANEISLTMNFGPTSLRAQSSGPPRDNFASATVFKKGSVIAIYDDTPDMAVSIDVMAVVNNMVATTDMTLSWSAAIDAR